MNDLGVESSHRDEMLSFLAENAKKTGIYLIAATSKPSPDVISGVVKSNMSAVISFKTNSVTESRAILDDEGAEKLDQGELLYKTKKMKKAVVVHYPDFDIINFPDPLLKEAIKYIIVCQTASASVLQRKFSLGYNRASAIIDFLEKNNFIGPLNGALPREIIITPEQFKEIFHEEI